MSDTDDEGVRSPQYAIALNDNTSTVTRTSKFTSVVAENQPTDLSSEDFSFARIQQLARNWQELLMENKSLNSQNQKLTLQLANKEGALTSKKRERTEESPSLPGNVLLDPSADSLREFLRALTDNWKSTQGLTITTRDDGLINIVVHGNQKVHTIPKIVSFANRTLRKPQKGDKAILLDGPHIGEHVTIVSVNGADQTAIVKVERMTKAEKEHKDKIVKHAGDLAEDYELFCEQWNPNDLKANIPLSDLAVRATDV